MEVNETVAPSYEVLRPMREETGGFPVYPDLADALVTAKQQPDDVVRHVMATCAGYAYSDADTVSMMMARMGLDKNSCVEISEFVDAMFICSTAFLVQSADGRVVILCFRGTQPANFINWLTDLDVNPDKIPIEFADTASGATFDVHAGFYRNVRATRYKVIAALQRALRGESVREGDASVTGRLEALYITGHSLGGAMAAVMAVMLRSEASYAPIVGALKGVYTFGQPMIGSPQLAAACDDDDVLGQRVFRYIYNHDVVPHLPPRESGDFSHFGREHRYRGKDAAGTWQVSQSAVGQGHLWDLFLAPTAFVALQLRRFRNVIFPSSLDDHGPQHYIAAVTPPGKTEFGD